MYCMKNIAMSIMRVSYISRIQNLGKCKFPFEVEFFDININCMKHLSPLTCLFVYIMLSNKLSNTMLF